MHGSDPPKDATRLHRTEMDSRLVIPRLKKKLPGMAVRPGLEKSR